MWNVPVTGLYRGTIAACYNKDIIFLKQHGGSFKAISTRVSWLFMMVTTF